MSAPTTGTTGRGTRQLAGLLAVAALAWAGLYALNEVLWDAGFAALGLDLRSRVWGCLLYTSDAADE